MTTQRNEEKQYREIEIKRGEPEGTRLFPDNYISTGKYTVLTLIPKNLFEQFHRVANIWFLIVSIFQVLPLQLSPTSSWATIAPLSLVLTVTMLKDAYLDFLRHKSDKILNNKPAYIWSEQRGTLEEVTWKDLQVGNLILIHMDEPIPADLLIINTSDRDRICYLESANLDGENNLKMRKALEDISRLAENHSKEGSFSTLYKLDGAILSCEHPNNRLYSFEGSLRVRGFPRPISVENNNILLRGSTLKNTEWVLGLIVYTGVDTKLMMNSQTPPHKRSKVERRVNKYLIIVFTLLFATATLSTGISIYETYENESKAEYFTGQSGDSSILNFITFMILYNSLVPISLYVTMDIIRVIQVFFIQWDLRIYYEPLDQPTIAKTGDLNEDLGQIEYVFSDKTGTLTENRMEFKRCSIKGELYGHLSSTIDENSFSCLNPHPKFKFMDPMLAKLVKRDESRSIQDFFECLALCHTVVTEVSETGELIYQAASPDEEALVIAAHGMGYSFEWSRSNNINLNKLGENQHFRLIGFNEFNSDRKRMSVVVKSVNEPDKPAVLYCKGADNAMIPRLKISSSELEVMNDHLREFSVEGLRTLVLAKRELTSEEVDEFERQWTHARNAIVDRSRRLEEVAEELEVKMQLVGVTAIEDKIQEGVPETIAGMMNAGIKVWVLTGDKQETAINISYASKLLKKSMNLLKVNVKSVTAAKNRLMGILDEHIYASEERDLSMTPYRTVNLDNVNLGLVVDGDSLLEIFKDAECLKHFSMITCLCSAVICCRVSPLQKAQVVRLVKNHFTFRPMTLAIGDGANDISMIQEAHVGIGISGNEGMQAANSSDYAITKFRFLLPLLLLHGRWNYRRISLVILYSFYKNFVLVLPMFFYSFRNDYSGTALYDSWLIMSYNVALTAIPIIVLGTLDKDLSAEEVLSCPKLYKEGIFSNRFNAKIFMKWTILAIIHSILIYYFAVEGSILMLAPEGYSEDLLTVGTSAFVCIVLTVSLVILLEMKEISLIFAAVLVLSNIFFYGYLAFYDHVMFPTPSLNGVSRALLNFPHQMMIMTLVPILCILINLTAIYVQAFWFPNKADKIRAKRNYNKVFAERLYQEPDLRSDNFKKLPLRAREFAGKLSEVFNSKGLKISVTEKKEHKKDISLNPYTLKFNNRYLEKDYRSHRSIKIINFIRKIFITITLLTVVWTIISLSTDSELSISLIVFRGTAILLMVLLVVASYSYYFIFYYEKIMIVVIISALSTKTLLDVMSSSDGSMVQATVPIVTFVLFDIATYKIFIINLLFLIIYLVRVCWMYSLNEQGEEVAQIGLNYILLLSIITLLSAFVGYSLEQGKREEFILLRHLRFQYKKGQDILSTLLPKFVIERVKQGLRYIAEDKGVVTVLFCDIYDFDMICATHTPNELLDLLDKFFSILDNLCEKYGITKIETVGKTYMACGGLKDSEITLSGSVIHQNHAIRATLLAFHILEKIEPLYLKNGEKFHVKIGINSGPVVAGVVGEHKPQFSLVGDTVNTASRMCSTIEFPDHIQISESTQESISSMNWSLEERSIEVKGKGRTRTFYVKNQQSNQLREQKPIMTFQEIESPPDMPDYYALRQSFKEKKLFESSNLKSQYTLKEIEENNTVNKDKMRISKEVQLITCSFKELKHQFLFRNYYTTLNLKFISIGLWLNTGVSFLLLIAFLVNDFWVFDPSRETFLLIFMRVISFLGIGYVAYNLNSLYKLYIYPWVLIVVYFLRGLGTVLSIKLYSSILVYKIVLEVMYINLVVNHISGLPFGFILIANSLLLANWLIFVLIDGQYLDYTIEATFFLFTFMALNGTVSYKREQQNRRAFNLKKLAQKEIDNTDILLKHMMPPDVVKNLKNDIVTTDRYSDVTIIFADICGFTKWSSDKPAIQIVTMLSKLFTAFDNLCAVHGVYKVHTIGDCYVILSFTEEKEFDGRRNVDKEATLMINMAFDMLQSIKKINRSKNVDLNMRIGIHTGEVIAGISGTNIVRYDIYGPDVDIANKMESGGQPGCINISEDTMQILQRSNPGRFEYAFNKVIVHEPVDRAVNSYFVTNKTEDLF